MARYLLDTNIVLFSLFNHDELEIEVSDLLDDYNNQFYVSVIISQAIAGKYTLISSDRKFESYTKQRLDFIFNCR